ncbi:hypothetical protein EVAR_69310_1 [Eumeta japonica]|uniref:Uncharacterized protein n=1 Tax=Eumeta variegata TaxID=151549 RepID=A0A4C2A321_EUMVA|nr:hypothetical protein EVAR_69310_1 [Eumeta japonica]
MKSGLEPIACPRSKPRTILGPELESYVHTGEAVGGKLIHFRLERALVGAATRVSGVGQERRAAGAGRGVRRDSTAAAVQGGSRDFR